MTTDPNQAVSYYAASANPAPEHPPLRGDQTADVCVIGGGIAGCSTALELAERGYKVVLLEAQRVGWGASGRSGGQAIAGFASGQQKLVQQVGAQNARRMWDISLEGLQLIRDRVAKYDIECDLHWGQMHVAIKPRQRADLLHEQREAEQTYGYTQLEFMERDKVESLLETRRYIAGLYDHGSGHLHPLNYTLGLAAAASAAGVTIHERSLVTNITHDQPAVVTTAGGRVRAKFVVLCGNAYLNTLVPSLRSRIMPVGTYIVATEPLGEARMHRLMRKNIAVTDINFVLDYFRRSADHRLLFGGRVSYSGLDPFNTSNATRKRMLKVFPQLADVRIEYAWGGYVDITMNRAPDFGRIAPHIYYLQGFSGHGIALTGIAGRLAAEAIAGQAERFDLFTRISHRNFPGGQFLRMPALVLAMLWYRARDLL
ncbi:FAD-binding oxidoreductase [Steroidobacter sp. S1-65]|uniref:FAD-binding oxidoreductase n=1 Tax=Steroidobacter gossypii TaxID=2805490 RepID=A0ABS1X3R9_9GAMM|nr:FAD-binding oxidoreductase [Steroidobacter gossypii]MBM0107863.1 FAD-binding oxidoreductase [Steroidobacter gossypii]